MDFKLLIQRINELARKKKECGLTEDELGEQARLRRIYIDNIKEQIKLNLDCIEFVDPKEGH